VALRMLWEGISQPVTYFRQLLRPSQMPAL
jgi:hypothetical protein